MNKEYEFCLRCGRKLKNPKAREKGFGAICERKMRQEENAKRLFDAEQKSQEK